MSGKSLDKDSAIKSILSDLKKGIDKPTIVSKYVERCHKSKRTVERWYEAAEIKYKEFMRKALPVIEYKEAEALAEVAASGILSKIERQKILTDIALGITKSTKPMMFMGDIIQAACAPTVADMRAAIAELNKMDGDYAPTKIEQNTQLSSPNIKVTIVKALEEDE